MDGFGFALEVCHNYRYIAAEFPDYLAARTAWRRERFGIGGDGDAFEFRFAVGNGFEYCDAFGTERQAICRRFDVAAFNYLAAFGFDGGSDLKIRIRCDRIFSSLECGCYQFVFAVLIRH